jgi:protein translocase SecG subunit
MKTIFIIVQIILSIILAVLVFLQTNGDSESRSNIMSQPPEKRGWEKIMFNLTIFVIVIFIISSIIQTLI